MYWLHQCIMEAMRVERCLRRAGCNRAVTQSPTQAVSAMKAKSRKGVTTFRRLYRHPSDQHSDFFAFGVGFFTPFTRFFTLHMMLDLHRQAKLGEEFQAVQAALRICWLWIVETCGNYILLEVGYRSILKS